MRRGAPPGRGRAPWHAAALGAALAVAALGPCAAETTHVTYLLGGLVSGPYRLEADLTAGTVHEARAARGAFGDGARLDPRTMPATATRPLPPATARRIATLAATVWRDGVASPTACPADRPPTVDAVQSFEITHDGALHQATAAAPCVSTAARALQRALYCAVHPDGTDCPG